MTVSGQDHDRKEEWGSEEEVTVDEVGRSNNPYLTKFEMPH